MSYPGQIFSFRNRIRPPTDEQVAHAPADGAVAVEHRVLVQRRRQLEREADVPAVAPAVVLPVALRLFSRHSSFRLEAVKICVMCGLVKRVVVARASQLWIVRCVERRAAMWLLLIHHPPSPRVETTWLSPPVSLPP